MNLSGKTAIITGSTRGIGRAIALALARQGANVVITGKTQVRHPTLEGTIDSVAQEVRALGGIALPFCVDVRNEAAIEEMVEAVVAQFGGVDILVNNASAINLSNTETLTFKHFDLMLSVNLRGTFACSKLCLPHLKKSDNPHILTLSPPINLSPQWFQDHVAYTISKYGMSMCTVGMAEEFRPYNIAVNALWPRTTIGTAAIKNLFPAELYAASRRPEIVALAAEYIVQEDSKQLTGQFLIDEDYLRTKGFNDFESFAIDSTQPLHSDLFL